MKLMGISAILESWGERALSSHSRQRENSPCGSSVGHNRVDKGHINCLSLAQDSVCVRVRDSVEIPRRWGERWEGGFRMGSTCTPMADSCQCMAKTTTIL